MKRLGVLFLITFIGVAISGCSTMKIGPEKSLFGGKRVTTASANQIFDPSFEGLSDEQLLHLLDPENKATLPKKYEELTESQRIKYLRMAFRKANTEADYGLAHRSQIQDRLFAASNQRCNLYTTYLKRVSTYQNGIFGTLTTILGGAGAIVTGADTARLLSGLAGISSGTRAELNQAIFESVATSIIIPGIQKSRSDLKKEILKKRSKTLEEYTIEGAIADAITYHGACSMDTGISYAQKSIQSFDDIGVKRFTDIQNELGIARSASESFTLRPLPSLVVAKIILDDFAKKLANYKAKIDTAKPEHKTLIDLHKSLKALTTEATTDAAGKVLEPGELRKEAIELDEDLKQKMLNYASTTGADKSDNYSLLEAQQIKAKDFSRKIEAKNTEFLIELKKFDK